MAVPSEWRFDALTGRKVLIAPARADRPIRPRDQCPFCEGFECETPAEVLAVRAPGTSQDGPGWQIRVVPNRYAAVRMPNIGTNLPPVLPALTRCLEGREPGVGVAEVIVECPHHEANFAKLAPQLVRAAVHAWRERLRHWRDDGRLAFAQVFKNEGPSAGASIDHCHSQLIGVAAVPPGVTRELDAFRKAAALAGRCPTCEVVDAGRRSERFVAESAEFIAACPFAPRFAGETWIIPKRCAPALEAVGDDEATAFADILLDVLARIGRVFKGPDYNVVIKGPPFRHVGPYHWRAEVLPRTSPSAGWEWGTGALINTLLPERAAELLR